MIKIIRAGLLSGSDRRLEERYLHRRSAYGPQIYVHAASGFLFDKLQSYGRGVRQLSLFKPWQKLFRANGHDLKRPSAC